MTQLSMSDRRILGYCGVDALAVADAERITLDDVRETRTRHGRRPSDGEPVSVHREQADAHARRARELHRAGMESDSHAEWSEANFQAAQAVLDELAEIAKLMRTNRSPSL